MLGVFCDEAWQESANDTQRDATKRDGEKGAYGEEVLFDGYVGHILEPFKCVVENHSDSVVEKWLSKHEEE